MYETPELFISLKYIKSKSPDKLQEEMLQIQVTAKKPVNFSTPEHTDGYWYTWYSYDYTQDIRPKDRLSINNTKEAK